MRRTVIPRLSTLFSSINDSSFFRPLSHSPLRHLFSPRQGLHIRTLATRQHQSHIFSVVGKSTEPPTQTMDDLTNQIKGLGLDAVPQVPDVLTYPTFNQVDIFRSHIAENVAKIVNVEAKLVYNAIQWTQTLANGDLMLPVPALRIKGKKPDAIANDIVEKFPESPLVQKPSIDKHFVRFFFKAEPLTKLVLPSILKNGTKYGYNPHLGLKDPKDVNSGKQKMIVEFSSPNIAKPFHAGHLRSTIIGGFLSNVYEGAGWDVTRMNYLGDWGKQYGVLAIGFHKFGSEEALLANPIAHLYDVYVKISAISHEEGEQLKKLNGNTQTERVRKLKEEIVALRAKAKKDPVTEESEKKLQEEIATRETEIGSLLEEADALQTKNAKEIEHITTTGVDQQARDYFKRMSDNDPDALGIWKKFRDLSIVKYKDTYARLNIHFNDYSGESQVKQESMEEAADVMKEKKISEDSEGAVIVDLTKHSKKLGKALVKKKDGTTLYLTRDIGAAMERHRSYNFDKMIYVVASQQDLHLAQLFKILEVMGGEFADVSNKCQHINFGMVLGMSTRKGTAKFLDDILRDVGEKMHEVMRSNDAKYVQVQDPEKTADTLGISAVMVQDMSGKRINNYEFDLARMTSFEGDTGPYLQYAHARLCSIARKASLTEADYASADLSLLTEKHAVEVIRSLAQWPDTFLNVIKTQEPVTVLTYLFKMTHLLSSSYEQLNVLNAEPEVKKARGALYDAARVVLSNGMRLLGLNPVQRM